IFWLVVGGCFALGIVALIPGTYEICTETGQHESCTQHRVLAFALLRVTEALDKVGGVVTAFATVAIAIFTLTLKRATDKLWAAGERQISAVEEANRISRESMIAGRRAWLSVDDVKLIHPTRFTEDGFILRVEAVIRNFGETPAKSVSV